MESNELRFKHVGVSSDGAVIFCEMDNGKTYAMPLCALDQAEDWNPKLKPKAAAIIHDGYGAIVKFDTGIKIDFPSDFVLHVCEQGPQCVRGRCPHPRDSQGARPDPGHPGSQVRYCQTQSVAD